MKTFLQNTEATTLRQKALALLSNRPSSSGLHLSESETQKIIHELEVHQIELEMQNEELMSARTVAQMSSDKYIELYDFAPSGYFTLSKAGIILELNFSGAQMLGKVRSSLKNRLFSASVDSDSKETFIHFLQNVFDSNVKEACEVTFNANDNSKAHVYLNGIATGNGEQCVVNMIDITDKKKTEQALIVANQELAFQKEKQTAELIIAKDRAEESDRLKSAFLANMSHEIRTPMNGILGFTELLKNPNLSGEKKNIYINSIEKGSERLLNIINDIISISKVESGQMNVARKETNINEQIEYIYNFFKKEAENKKIQLSFNNSLPNNEAFLNTDREKVYAVLTNLINNAIKFTQTGSITFGYVKKDKDLEFYVKDTGVGIRPDQLKVVFKRFKQGSESLSRNYEGAGLGLSIAKAYIGMLGGKIWIESEEGIGSTFYFTIPFNTKPAKKDIVIKDTVAFKEAENKIDNIKILIAEDDELSALLQKEIVGKYSSDILQVMTGIEAIEACHSHPDIDLILMDMKMPEMNGYEATSQIRLFNKKVIIIAQTAYAFASNKEKALAAGCNDYISKPINKALMIALMEKYFNKSVDRQKN